MLALHGKIDGGWRSVAGWHMVRDRLWAHNGCLGVGALAVSCSRPAR
jgi:hypothetical protein